MSRRVSTKPRIIIVADMVDLTILVLMGWAVGQLFAAGMMPPAIGGATAVALLVIRQLWP